MKMAVLITLLLISGYIYMPAQKNNYFTLKEEEFLKYGRNDETRGFINIEDYIFDKSGNIFLPDYRVGKIYKFSNDGKLLNSIGRSGQGPGELARFFFTVLSPDEKLYVINNFEGRKDVPVFDKNYKYFKNLDLAKTNYDIISCVMLDDGIVAINCKESYKTPQKKLGFKEYIAVTNLANLKQTVVSESIPLKSYMAIDRFTNIVKDSRNHFYFGLISKKEYCVYQYDFNGKMIKKISLGFDPVFMNAFYRESFESSSKDYKKLFQKYPLDVEEENDFHFDIINYLAIDSYDNLWVFTSEKQNDETISVDLFDKNGNFKKTFYLKGNGIGKQPWSRYYVYKDYLYYRCLDSKRDNHLYRYKLPAEIWK
jgi:hypothetical protein